MALKVYYGHKSGCSPRCFGRQINGQNPMEIILLPVIDCASHSMVLLCAKYLRPTNTEPGGCLIESTSNLQSKGLKSKPPK